MLGPGTDIFLSYKAEDRARLAPLVAALEHEGFSVWWDAHIGGGTNWQEDIEQHLDAAKCVIVVWSKRSIGHDGHFVRDEARQALKRNAYVPVCLDPVEPPLGFREVQAVSLKGWRGDPADPRFQAVAAAVRSHISGEHVWHHPHVEFYQPRISRRAAIAGGAGVAVAAAAGGWFLMKPTPADAKRIAVLPFANLAGSQDQAYFAEGIAEELRSALSRIGMQVIGRASSDAVKDLDTKAAASKLGVSNILTGSVRRSPEMVRINAQLVDGEDGVERWAQSYDRAPGDEIKIQTDIATNVAEALSLALGRTGKAALTLGGTSDAGAHDLFLRARTLFVTATDKDSDQQSLALVDAAIARDPNYAEAYVLKGRILRDLGGSYPNNAADMADKFAHAKGAAQRAIALEPRFGPAYAELALVDKTRLDFADAVRNMREALALSPEDADVIRPAAGFMAAFGDSRKALELANRWIALDPLQAGAHANRADVLAWAMRDYPQAINGYRKALELSPRYVQAHSQIADCLLLMNRSAEAKSEYAKLPADHPFRLLGEAIIAARSHNIVEAEKIAARMRELFGDTASYQYADIQAQARNADGAFAELENAMRIQDPGLSVLKYDPWLEPIRGDPRFAALLKRLNFPTWS